MIRQACALLISACLVGCIDIHVGDNINGQSEFVTTVVGPAHDAEVQLAEASVWLVPPLEPFSDENQHITWTLLHPSIVTRTLIRRTCTEVPEAFLWISDPPNWGSSEALATFHGCGNPGQFYATVELMFDGIEWIGVSATGAATILPPE